MNPWETLLFILASGIAVGLAVIIIGFFFLFCGAVMAAGEKFMGNVLHDNKRNKQ